MPVTLQPTPMQVIMWAGNVAVVYRRNEMFWIQNMWTNKSFNTDSYAEAYFFAQFDMEYVVVDRMTMQHVIVLRS